MIVPRRIRALLDMLPKLASEPGPDPAPPPPEREYVPGQRALRPGCQWIGHCGERARRRYLRQRCLPVYRLKDAYSVRALARIRAAVAGDPEPILGEWNLIDVTLQASRECGTTWAEAANHLLDKFDARARESA